MTFAAFSATAHREHGSVAALIPLLSRGRMSSLHVVSVPAHLHPDYLDGAPVAALGVCGDFLFFRDALGQPRALHFDQLNKVGILSLFGGDVAALVDLWPAVGPTGALVGWSCLRVAGPLVLTAVIIRYSLRSIPVVLRDQARRAPPGSA